MRYDTSEPLVVIVHLLAQWINIKKLEHFYIKAISFYAVSLTIYTLASPNDCVFHWSTVCTRTRRGLVRCPRWLCSTDRTAAPWCRCASTPSWCRCSTMRTSAWRPCAAAWRSRWWKPWFPASTWTTRPSTTCSPAAASWSEALRWGRRGKIWMLMLFYYFES